MCNCLQDNLSQHGLQGPSWTDTCWPLSLISYISPTGIHSSHWILSVLWKLHGLSWTWIDLTLTNSLSFSLSRNVFILPLLLKNSFPEYKILAWPLFPPRLWICHSNVFWYSLFIMRIKSLIVLLFPSVMHNFCLTSRFSLYLWLSAVRLGCV